MELYVFKFFISIGLHFYLETLESSLCSDMCIRQLLTSFQ